MPRPSLSKSSRKSKKTPPRRKTPATAKAAPAKAARAKTARSKAAAPFSAIEAICRKRSGGALTPDEIAALVNAYVAGDVADYQMSAFAMAVYFQGMKPEEITALTLAMRDSGKVVDLSKVKGAKVDKHSTGGVGDKVSICLAPIVAACGVKVPMVSGRGLGHSGGTLDKLESIPGFRVDQTTAAFVKQVAKVGCSLIGQTHDIAPADKKLYALRDVTGTVESVPLITASILSKKLAEGIDALVLDVKVGRGAFMKTLPEARTLAKSLVRVGTLAGKKVTAVLTRMDEPLGRAVGNALETAEALEVLHGDGPEDLIELTYVLGAEMLRMAGVAKTDADARAKMKKAIDSGAAARKMEEIIRAQHGDPRVVADPERLPRAPHVIQIFSKLAGFVESIDSLEVGLATVSIGAGRQRTDDIIDPAVGAVLHVKVGDQVDRGDPLAEVHLRDLRDLDRVHDRIRDAFVIAKRPPKRHDIVIETIRG
jgi:pyrimidine-nucleoside phosphorylase